MEASEDWQTALAFCRYRVTLVAREPLDLPPYPGSTLRGAFGEAFRRLACPTGGNGTCLIPAGCPYHQVFETELPPGSGALSTYDEIVRPFVIVPVLSPNPGPGRIILNSGDHLVFEVTLVGRARRFVAYFAAAFRELHRIGRNRRAVDLVRIEALDPRNGVSQPVYDAADDLLLDTKVSLTIRDCMVCPPPSNRLRARFLTQIRLLDNGRIARVPEFQLLFRRLLGRLSSLARFHCGAPLEVDFRDLIEQAARIRMVADNTCWTTWERYSSRQDRRMRWSGIIGDAIYEGDFSAFYPYLVFGQWVHVGKGATFGLGRYVLEEA